MAANLIKYRHAFNVSQIILDKSTTEEFPLDLFTLIKDANPTILVSTLSDFISWNKLIHPSTFVIPNIVDARCYYYPAIDGRIIVYNENQSYERIRFSIAHELGHIVLGHLNDKRTEMSRGGVTDPLYYAMEGAANVFAGNLLAPPILINEILDGKPFSVAMIVTSFEISERSVREYRQSDYETWLKWKPSQQETNVVLRVKNKMYPHFCENCYGVSYGAKAKFCIFCGSEDFKYRGKDIIARHPHHKYFTWKRKYEMKYRQIKTSKSGHVTECPYCNNEEIISNGIYCHICGKPARNQCAAAHDDPNYRETYYFPCNESENVLIPSNARYCPYCGEETNFNRAGMLKTWREEKTEIDQEDVPNFPWEQETDNNKDSLQTIPDDIDGLPF